MFLLSVAFSNSGTAEKCSYCSSGLGNYKKKKKSIKNMAFSDC